MAKARKLYFGVGLLILTGLALGVGFVLFLTSGRIGETASVIETYSRESVTGLDVGAPVRYRGVAIGRVTEITLVSATYARGDILPTTPEYQLVLLRFAVDTRRLGQIPNLSVALDLGLRVRIAAQGITGISYLDLDFHDPERYPIPVYPWTPRYPVIPSIPSTVSQVTSGAERLLQRLDELDIETLLTNLTGLLGDMRRIAGSDDIPRVLREAAGLFEELRRVAGTDDLPRAIREAAETMVALRGAVAEADIAGTLRAIREAATAVDEMAVAIDRMAAGPDLRNATASIGQVATDLRVAIARLPAAVQSLEATIRAARVATTDTQSDLVPLLRDLRAVAANLRDVTEALRRSPSQTLLGAPPPPPERPR